jgi:mitochondrial fission protein ELM1
MSISSDKPASSRRVWALLGAHGGDNDQILALAKSLNIPFATKQLNYNALRRLGPHLLGRSLASLTFDSRETLLNEVSPALTISAGHRSVPVVRALRHRSGGRTRSIHIGFPRVSPSFFDLVIATPQYPVPDHPNVLRVPYALTTEALVSSNQDVVSELSAYPSPRQLLVVGGPTLYWDIDQRAVLATLSAMLDSARHDGGSVFVTTSPRTPAQLRGKLEAILASTPVPALLAKPKQQPTLATLFAAANSIRVTADSVAMISDAIWAGKPLALIPIARSRLGRLAFAIADRVRPGRPVYPRDHRFFWKKLREIGVGEELTVPRTSPAAVMDTVLQRIGPILDGIGAAGVLY